MTTDELKALVESWLVEALQLRANCGVPDVGVPGPADIRQALLTVRQSLDRIDELLVHSVRLRASAQRTALAAKATADDAWDEAARRVAGHEYQSARERSAQLNLHTVGALRQQRHTEEFLSLANEAHDVLRLVQRSTDGVRMDVHRMMTALQFESGLER